MKTLVFAFFFCLFAIHGIAQTSAVTSSGEEVILYGDGTWKYAKGAGEKKPITTNPSAFMHSKDATFQVTSEVVKAGVYLNPKKWSFKKGTGDGSAEFNFELKKKDAYAMLIPEKIEIPLESLRNIAFSNAKEAAPDVGIVNEEYRTVNGKNVLCMQMEGTVSGIRFTYFGYYYSSKGGVLQLLTYTSQSLFAEYKPDMEELLNGLVVSD